MFQTTDSHEELTLTPTERAIVKNFVTDLENQSRFWTPGIVLLAILIILSTLLALHCIHQFVDCIQTAPSISQHFEDIEKPANAPPDLWFVAELRRTAKFLELRNKMHMIATIEGVTGSILLAINIFLGVLISSRWKIAPKKAILAKLIRWQMAQF